MSWFLVSFHSSRLLLFGKIPANIVSCFKRRIFVDSRTEQHSLRPVGSHSWDVTLRAGTLKLSQIKDSRAEGQKMTCLYWSCKKTAFRHDSDWYWAKSKEALQILHLFGKEQNGFAGGSLTQHWKFCLWLYNKSTVSCLLIRLSASHLPNKANDFYLDSSNAREITLQRNFMTWKNKSSIHCFQKVPNGRRYSTGRKETLP